MSNTSATGGPLTPASLPSVDALDRLLHSFISGLSGLSGGMVRPLWQQRPVKQPEVNENWCAYGIKIGGREKGLAVVVPGERMIDVVISPAVPATETTPAVPAVTEEQLQEFATLSRSERIEVQVTFYGPDCMEYAGMLRDGIEIAQNREVLYLAGLNVGWVDDEAIRVPEKIGELWYDRADLGFVLNRSMTREYAILSLQSAGGSIASEAVETSFNVTQNP